MTKTAKRRKGDIGEEIALEYLINKGFSLLTRNYLKPWGELDIVMKQGNTIHFVEVKTARLPDGQVSREPRLARLSPAKRENLQIRPEENMHKRKILRLKRAIQTYVLDHRVPRTMEWQIDLACVYLDFSARRARVEVLENIIGT